MAALDTVPDGSNVLIDANIFIFALSNRSDQCKNFLTRCSREQIYGITLHEVVHDATHIFMCAEAVAKGMPAKKTPKYLSEHPDQVKALTDYWVNTQNVLALNLVLLPMEEKIIVGAHSERKNAGLLTMDSVIVASMREYDITKIATNDQMFNSVNGLSVFTPTDV
jgi:predicted nucleic acid-binding protein